MKKILIVVILLISLVITACSTKEPPQQPLDNKKDNANQINEEIKTGVEEKISNEQDKDNSNSSSKNQTLFKFTSPDKQTRIEMDIDINQISEGVPFNFYIYFKDELIKELTVWDVTRDPVVWLDNKRAIIGGQWLINVETGQTKYIWPEEEYIFTYRYSPNKKYLAICQKADYEDRKDILGFKILLIKLEDLSVKHLYTFPGSRVWTSGISFNITWLDDEILLFDGNHDEVPTIFKYSLNKDTVEIFISQAWGPAAAPYGNFISYFEMPYYYYKPEKWETIIKNITQDKQIKVNGIISWINNNTYIVYGENHGEIYKINNDLNYKKVDTIADKLVEVMFIKGNEKNYKVYYLYWQDGIIKSNVKEVFF
ncbi:MAG: hypothetical protein PWQ67_2430 [Clostridia bacterium]|jgi:hypothetical protein|nr:hypothetical protein [Clostridia bacterium]MDN5323976.1 hypothetical protein [Clostridia bacterium]